MLTVLNNLKPLRDGRQTRLCWCWTIHRSDGVVMRMTEHHHKLQLADGSIYYPATFSGSAHQQAQGLRDSNTEFAGALSSDYITEADMHAGVYNDARIESQLVDWRYPWAGVLDRRVAWIERVEFDGERFSAQVVGPANRMHNDVGGVVSRNCPLELGSARCGVDLSLAEVTRTVMFVGDPRLSVQAVFLGVENPYVGGPIDSLYFQDGRLEWLTGANAGSISEVAKYTSSSGQLDFFLPTRADILEGDEFKITPGCQLLWEESCGARFANKANFDGDPHVPGMDRIIHPQGTAQ